MNQAIQPIQILRKPQNTTQMTSVHLCPVNRSSWHIITNHKAIVLGMVGVVPATRSMSNALFLYCAHHLNNHCVNDFEKYVGCQNLGIVNEGNIILMTEVVPLISVTKSTLYIGRRKKQFEIIFSLSCQKKLIVPQVLSSTIYLI